MSLTSPTLDELQFELTGALIQPTDPDWDAVRTAWNLAVDQQPVAVLIPATVDDIRRIVRHAASAGLQVAAQTTGHLAAALGDLGQTILVRTTKLRRIGIDTEAMVVRAEAGVTWGEVTGHLQGMNLAALAGSSPDVGVVGYTLAGGYSWFARSRGLASSSVTAVELVLADGRLVRADAQTEPELFWALRGGGGAFGIVTAVEFRVYPVSTVYAGMLLFPFDRAREVLLAYAEWAHDGLDESVTTSARLLRFPPLPEVPEFLRGQSFVGVDGAISAPDADAESLLKPLRALGPVIDTFTGMPASALASVHLDPPTPVPAVGDGIIVDVLSPAVIDALLATSAGRAASPLLVTDLRHLGGAVGRAAPHGGAIDRLPGRFLVYAAGIAPSPEAAAVVADAVESIRKALSPWASAHDYSNFRERPVAPEGIWPEPVLERLRAVKAAVDPAGLIRAAHPLGA